MAKKKKRKKKTSSVEMKVGFDMRKHLEEMGAKLTTNLKATNQISLMTGILPLDLILSPDGGLKSGCTEVWGPEGIGKTSFALSLLKSCKAHGHPALFIDAEFRLTEELCKIFDIMPDEDFLLKQPDDAEDALNNAERFLKLSPKSVVIIDSIPALLSAAEWEENVEDKNYNPVTLMLSKFVKRAQKYCKRNNSIVIYLNQTRANMSGYGSPIRVPGPSAIKFFTNWRIEMKKNDTIKDGEEPMGHLVEFKTHKNLLTRPYQKAQSHLIYGQGFHQGYDLPILCKMFGMGHLVKLNGSWFEFYNGNKVQGLKNAAEYIVSNPEVHDHIKSEILETLQ